MLAESWLRGYAYPVAHGFGVKMKPPRTAPNETLLVQERG